MSNEKMKILEMVENKVISVEEGLKLLNAIDKIEESTILPKDIKEDVQVQINEALEAAQEEREEALEELSEELEGMVEELEEEIEEIVEEIEDAYEEVTDEINEDAAKRLNEKVDELKKKAEKIKTKVKVDVEMNGERFKKEFYTSDFKNVFDQNFKREFANLKRSFKTDMKSFGKEAKRFGEEMAKLGQEMGNISVEVVDEALSNIDTVNFGSDLKEEDFVMEADAEMSNYSLAQEFSIDCDGKKDISINVVSTDVTIVTEERDDILVNYIKYNSNDADKYKVVVEEDSKKIRISEKQVQKNKKNFFGWSVSTGGRELLIRLPRKYKESLSVKTVSGDVDMNYLDSDFFRFSSVSGDLTADIIYSVNSLVKTTSGDAEIGLFRGSMMFSSVSGDLDVKYEKLDGDFTMKTVSGDAEITLPKNTEFEVIGKSLSGDVNCAFPMTIIGTKKRGRIRGQVGSSEYKVAMNTTSGDLDILKY